MTHGKRAWAGMGWGLACMGNVWCGVHGEEEGLSNRAHMHGEEGVVMLGPHAWGWWKVDRGFRFESPLFFLRTGPVTVPVEAHHSSRPVPGQKGSVQLRVENGPGQFWFNKLIFSTQPVTGPQPVGGPVIFVTGSGRFTVHTSRFWTEPAHLTTLPATQPSPFRPLIWHHGWGPTNHWRNSTKRLHHPLLPHLKATSWTSKSLLTPESDSHWESHRRLQTQCNSYWR